MTSSETQKKLPPKPPLKARLTAAKILANFSPTAAFRKGRATAEPNQPLTSELEAHLCQLAALENYADHGLYVKFSDEEAAALEDRALDLAVGESNADEAARMSGRPLPSRGRGSSATFTKAEAEELLARLRTDEDPLFSAVASSLAAGQEPRPTVRSSPAAEREAMSPPSKMSSFSAFKKRLLPKLGKSKKSSLPPVPRASSELPPGTLGHGYSPGSYDHFAAEAQEHGMDYSNGYIFPKDYIKEGQKGRQLGGGEDVHNLEQERMQRALAISAAQNQAETNSRHNDEDGALLAVALEESKVQAEFDQVLRDAKMLRQDLEHEQSRCFSKHRDLEAQRADLEAKRSRLGGKQGPPPHLIRQCAEALHNAKEAQSRATSLGEAAEELGHLEAYIRTVKPPKDDAIALTETIVRELLERLNFQGFDFHVPDAKQEAGSTDIQHILAKYRKANPASATASPVRLPAKLSPRSPPLPSTAPTLQSTPISTPRESLRRTETPRSSIGSEDALPPPLPDARMGIQELEAPMEIQDAPFQGAAVSIRASPFASTASPQAPSTPVKAAAKRNSSQVPFKIPDLPWRSGGGAPLPPVAGHRLSSSRLGTPRAETKPPVTVTKASERLAKLSSDKKPPLKSPGKALVRRESQSLERMLSTSSAGSSLDKPRGSFSAKRSSQVVHLYNELRKVMPGVMETAYAQSSPVDVTFRSSEGDAPASLLLAESEAAAKSEAEQHIRLLNKLAARLSRAKPNDAASACELEHDIKTQLSSVRSDLDTVLTASPSWSMGKWTALKQVTSLHSELGDLGQKITNWTIGEESRRRGSLSHASVQGGFQEEVMALELFFDPARVRVEDIQRRVRDSEKRWAAADIPWDSNSVRLCRHTSLHLATLFMSRALVEVADLERSQTLKAEACIADLAAAVRVAYKVHQFVGGFHSDASELFEKIKRLAQFYIRSRDPTWLRDSSKLTR